MTTTWKPYSFEGLDYKSARKLDSWEDIADNKIPRSELQKPYFSNRDDYDNYESWEWFWPDWEWSGPALDIPWSFDEPVENPCNTEGQCTWLFITGKDQLTCGETETYVAYHGWEGCEIAPWFAAFVGFEVEGPAKIVSQTPFSVTIKVDENASDGSNVQIRAFAEGGCSAMFLAIIECGCNDCIQPVISGSVTITQSDSKILTVTPACPEANAFCSASCLDVTVELNDAGSQITVTTGANACGTIEVTLKCSQLWTVTHELRVTDSGGWEFFDRTCTQPGCGSPSACALVRSDGGGCISGVTCFTYSPFCVDGSPGPCPSGGCLPPCDVACSTGPCIGNPCCSSTLDEYDWTCDGTASVC